MLNLLKIKGIGLEDDNKLYVESSNRKTECYLNKNKYINERNLELSKSRCQRFIQPTNVCLIKFCFMPSCISHTAWEPAVCWELLGVYCRNNDHFIPPSKLNLTSLSKYQLHLVLLYLLPMIRSTTCHLIINIQKKIKLTPLWGVTE